MGEQAQGVQNKGMLIVAAVLGVAVVIVYNWQIEAIRRESRGEQATILRQLRAGGAKLTCVRIYETPEIFAEFRGEA